MLKHLPLLILVIFSHLSNAQTYAERLGYPAGAKIVILHVDDMGMSYDSNLGGIRAMEEGVATSTSVMMPCPWVPGFVRYLKEHPKADAGLHLTLTSEWQDYRWGPLTGTASPNLLDDEGCLWHSVEALAQHANPDDVEREFDSQLARARRMGFEPTHADTHMGSAFGTPEFLERYLQFGIKNQLPIMFPGGHNSMIINQLQGLSMPPEKARAIGQMLWDAGLPVLDDLHNLSYNWQYPADHGMTDEQLQKVHAQQYIESFSQLQPGITMVIMHCSATTEVFPHISDSGPLRRADMLAMLSPDLKKYIEENGIILTTWRELMERRGKVRE
ncbi:MAG: polysaccharide deacetylase family protein [Saprospiraceae bacterium]|nr:polysaccharide deacetylase family protein [Saprospiraceae bacterium]MCF8252767.1 polysaccharide deacetylase family protein [Saprospiraceae bacterium]MCF8283139.1 polysaccharide deacetylase family protein [Bacteroidales bacterium]MCF8314323.1 polysaccharide deacetylase family protein [Saprospiraceae bacterium]MCF8443194.1 polysaccharide deacetylase family protein [Saprospiraceae bacterium]